ncbi:unnamed protein product [Rhizophagus irregularis]|nr:unnamed protein product [Rhizophagus irregularis]CAB5359294.1 unnamed protein product [Rhizophagus irregularis]
MMNKNMDSGYNNINERIELGFGLIAKKFDLLYNVISVKDKEIAVINREITVINRKNSANKGNIGEKIQMLKVKIDLFYLTNSKKEGGGVIWNRNRFHH